MPEIKNIFSAGRMNKDLDDRVLPEKEYRDALNVQISTSDDSDVGTVQNISGNEQISLLIDSTAKQIGKVKDTENNKIYWFVATDTKSLILEFDEASKSVVPVLVDIYSILNFSTNYLITGVNIVDGLLFFTDNQTEPKKINIQKFKEGSSNFTTHTQVYGRNFQESDITLIKQKPNNAPSISLSNKIGSDNVESAANFNFSKNNGADPVGVGESYTINILNANREWAIGDILIFEEEQNEGDFRNDGPVTIKGIITNYNNGASVTIEVVTATDDYVATPIQYSVIKEQPDPLFELKFPRFACRWKYEDGEYSVFSPFSEVAFLPGEARYSAKNGYNEGMVNTVRKINLYEFDTPPDNVEEVEILYKESNNNNVYTVESIKKDELFSKGLYSVTSEIIYKVVENNQLLRAWDNVPKKARAQEFTSNRLMFGNYTQGYNIEKEPNVNARILSRTGNGASVKSDRIYQVGTVFEDGYGRQSPIIANQTGVLKLDRAASDKKNSIAINGTTEPPSWASRYKYYIKETSAPYYNVLIDKYYLNKDEPNSVWISLPSSERNKVTEETYLILKKQHGTDVAVEDVSTKYKILDIDNEAPNFLTDKFQSKGQLKVVAVTDAVAENSSNINVTIEVNETLSETLSSGQKLKFVTGSNKSDIYTISNVTFSGTDNTTLDLVVNEVFNDTDVANFGSLTGFNISFGEVETKISPEFKNRFFIKLLIDPLLKANLLLTQDKVTNYRIIDNKVMQGNDYSNINPSCPSIGGGDDNTGYYWESRSTGSSIIKIRRQGTPDGQNFWNYDLNTRFDDFSAKIDIVGSKITFEDDSSAEVYEIVSSSRAKGDNGVDGVFGGLRKIGCNRYIEWTIELDKNINFTPSNTLEKKIFIVDDIINDENNTLVLENPAIFETEPEETADLDLYYETEKSYPIADWYTQKELKWFNCFAFGNGVESDRIRDDFNGVLMGKQVRVSSVIAEQFKEEEKKNTIIFSGIYNSINGINQTNQFNQAEAITKDLNPEYGSVQKLHARDGELIALTEDKILRIQSNKDLLYNADGSSSLISSNRVLGNSIPAAGNFGISKNPESFAEYGNRFYFTDKARNAVLRWGGDGLTLISKYGMSDYFKDLMRSNNKNFIGTFDEDLGTYNVSIGDQTVGFSETQKGWTSRYSFIPEGGISLNGNYYTFKEGNIWLHNVEGRNKNNFYNSQYKSSIRFLFNQSASSVKKYKTLSYEGDEGWVASSIKTNLQDGSIETFVDKEGKFFNYIKGDKTILDIPLKTNNWDSKQFSSQGIGFAADLGGDLEITVAVMDAYIVKAVVEWVGDTYECVQT